VDHSEYSISTDKSRFDVKLIHEFLTNSYWAEGVPLEIVRRSIQNTLGFGVFHVYQQVGFARVITDFATYAYIGDVFVLPEHRGRGLGKLLMRTIMTHPELQNLRRWSLVTSDANGLYAQFGFTSLANPDGYMELRNPDVYKRATGKLKQRTPAY
jgi:GNAT superfamily N-acetyltransferase